MTETQRAIFAFIVEYVDQHGYPPTVREIGESFGRSTSYVARHLRVLQSHDAIDLTTRVARGIRIIDRSVLDA